jgi:hypothetical protein
MTQEFNERRDGIEMLLMRGLITPADYRRRMDLIAAEEAVWEKRMDNARDMLAEWCWKDPT